LSQGVGDTERDHDEREVGVGPVIVILQRRTEDAQCLSVDVVDDGGKKEERPDAPSELVSRNHAGSIVENQGLGDCTKPCRFSLRASRSSANACEQRAATSSGSLDTTSLTTTASSPTVCLQ